jgi:preprotein translocase subunit YajC
MKALLSFVVLTGLVLGVAGAVPAQDWQRVHGTVQSVGGTTITVKTDDGRVLTVDAASVSPDIRGALAPNAGVTLIGRAGAQANQFTAQYIQQDSSDPSRGGAVAGSAPSASPGPVDQTAWQRVHGTVSAVSGTTLSLKADDGRVVNVDMKDVAEGVRQSLNAGEPVTVVGFFQGNQNTVAAKFVQKDSSAK